MRPIRDKRRFVNYYFSDLKIISNILLILIVICTLIFIFSAIKVKRNSLNRTVIDSTAKNDSSIETENKNTIEDSNIQNVENSENIINEQSKKTGGNENTSKPSEAEKSKPRETTINMAFTGDIMCHNTIYNDAYSASTDTYDFSYIFDNIKYYIQTADIAVGNLETTFAGKAKGYSSYPTFNTPESLAYNLKKLGFDVLSTANNHCYDSGYNGIESTIDYLDDADIAHTGTYKSEEAQKTILMQNVRGIQIAFLSFTYGTNGINVPSDKAYSVNLIDNDLILEQLSLAKALSPDLICVCMHWGVEYQTSPNAEQKQLADFLFKNGADIIIGNHPHVLQPMEKREITLENGATKTGFVIYSLGNFIADQTKTYTRDSAILNLSVTKNPEGKVSIGSATYTPIYTYKDKNAKTQKFKLIDLKDVIKSYDAGYNQSIGSSLYNTFKTELNNIESILGE